MGEHALPYKPPKSTLVIQKLVDQTKNCFECNRKIGKSHREKTNIKSTHLMEVKRTHQIKSFREKEKEKPKVG